VLGQHLASQIKIMHISQEVLRCLKRFYISKVPQQFFVSLEELSELFCRQYCLLSLGDLRQRAYCLALQTQYGAEGHTSRIEMKT
jgi:hypothetical protein